MKFQRTPHTRLLEVVEYEQGEVDLARTAMQDNPWLKTLHTKLGEPLLYRSFSNAEVGALRAYNVTIEEVSK